MIEYRSFNFTDWDGIITFINMMFGIILEGSKSYKPEDRYWKQEYCKMNTELPYKLMMILQSYGFDMGYQKEILNAIRLEARK